MRAATIERKTFETEIKLTINLDGSGTSQINTKIPFFDHMLTLFSKHGSFDLMVEANGDIDVDLHHTIEDIGICLGQALKQALGTKKGINRYGFFILPMDEAQCKTVIDISNRPYLKYSVLFPTEKTGNFDAQLVQEFFQALVVNGGLTLHIDVAHGENVHHIIEAIFKCFARALSHASSINPKSDEIPSTKGIL
ncbi:MAG: imidazoleglycerol-phosphate dehydratase HisB [Candidatus Margulisiibacteriota bacterium]|nr:MAG: imidazoleglycerol-phosphate dehydratase [Candidatus Margulisbacteria bacterium GWD2_39_127]OGI05226.1 MAG: imidazoleglycerol-phosphate dehydratase [Candidatus Margulisbacteria bacterium GWF2_38_17]OGI06275.1 MAG: imidazoleglycerol-phosphate dehydratase [Candidatus Margulisbacteria bacterium GWE2_39_32]PZM78932.1 MAG: imidazoleglycerol-phosphate dehydratase HisB [Candidatus Margulisiibacteriota bacterium]HAR64483.1 imidazoleglycerol-phosphate dehydratase HisB [Candidatus Margulisiibacter